jgi:hypothetical protein
MTNRESEMIRSTLRASLACAVLMPALTLTVGCKKEEPPPPPPPPPKQVARPVDAQSFVSDPRVQFPQEHAPTDESLAQAVADFTSALAKGDNNALSAMLDAPGRAILTEQVQTGAWERETSNIETVRVVALNRDGENANLTVAVQDPRGAYLLGWKAARTNADAWVFGGAPAPDARAPRASDLDDAVASETE